MHTWCAMSNRVLPLSKELRRLVEERIEHTLMGIEDTLRSILSSQNLTFEDLKKDLKSLEESFNLLSQKWNLEIIYTLLLRNTVSFSELKRLLGVNSRPLSDKLKILKIHGFIDRTVEPGPPLRVNYNLTQKGRNTALMALPLLYYLSLAD
ncbi:MAG: helix-turn-helix domain-containing protein [Candidatus Bathyarchaeia archaeon]